MSAALRMERIEEVSPRLKAVVSASVWTDESDLSCLADSALKIAARFWLRRGGRPVRHGSWSFGTDRCNGGGDLCGHHGHVAASHVR
jgi:hypothetical protein